MQSLGRLVHCMGPSAWPGGCKKGSLSQAEGYAGFERISDAGSLARSFSFLFLSSLPQTPPSHLPVSPWLHRPGLPQLVLTPPPASVLHVPPRRRAPPHDPAGSPLMHGQLPPALGRRPWTPLRLRRSPTADEERHRHQDPWPPLLIKRRRRPRTSDAAARQIMPRRAAGSKEPTVWSHRDPASLYPVALRCCVLLFPHQFQ